MTPERAKELLPIIQAYAEGKTVQVQTPLGEWFNMKDPDFSWDNGKYRIKPEVVRYRRYIYRGESECITLILNSNSVMFPIDIEKNRYFIRWIDTDWVEEDV